MSWVAGMASPILGSPAHLLDDRGPLSALPGRYAHSPSVHLAVSRVRRHNSLDLLTMEADPIGKKLQGAEEKEVCMG